MFCKPLTKILYLMYLQFWFYLDLCKTKIFLSSSPHCDGNSYADKLKNPHMRENQQKLKNQHAGNRPLSTEKAAGVDIMLVKLVKLVTNYLAGLLSQTINNSIKESLCDGNIKVAMFTPVDKKTDSKSSMLNFSPINVLSCFSEAS